MTVEQAEFMEQYINSGFKMEKANKQTNKTIWIDTCNTAM